MSDQRDDIEADSPEDAQQGAGGRVRFQGIVEAEARAAAAAGGGNDDLAAIAPIAHDEQRWNAQSRQIWQACKLTALFVFFAVMLGTPLGNFLAHLKLNNGSAEGWDLFAVYGFETLLFAFIVPVLVLLIGYALSHMATMLKAAESIAAVAQRMTTPDIAAAQNAEVVGEVVRGHMEQLNQGLDGALERLAGVEAMIRDHVAAIELAGDAIEHKATGAVERVADERSRLMELTESLNAHADSFAAAIAERAKASIEALDTADTISTRAESEFDDRLQRLEGAAAQALTSFESLRDALRDTSETMRENAETIEGAATQTLAATQKAQAASDAAADTAARNAANVAASANRAAEKAKQAAEEAIEVAGAEAERVAQSAIETATEHSTKVHKATTKAVDDMTAATSEALDAARADADKATQAAEDITAAARETSEAAKEASSNVAAAGEEARKSAEEATKHTENAAKQMEERNAALASARAELEKENQRLESLIEEQRNRADRLANAIASQTDRLSQLAEKQLQEQQAAERLATEQRDLAAHAEKEERQRKAAEKERAAEKKAQEARAAKAAKLEEERAAKDRAAEEKAAAKQASEEKRQRTERIAAKQAEERTASSKGAERLEALARDIAERRPRREQKKKSAAPKPAAEEGKRSKGDVSWREILDAADAEPLELGDVAKKTPAEARDDAANAIRIISGLQDFTHELETRLYGDPPPALQERYDRGDRNVFANRLLRLNEADVKRRIRNESARDKGFEKSVHQFLQNFERLLEDATTSETADEELEEYLSSPLGRVYLLIGATVGYFA